MARAATLEREVVYHRYYDPATEQFLSVDPLVDETGTPYAFSFNDPVNEAVPSGLMGKGGQQGQNTRGETEEEVAQDLANAQEQLKNLPRSCSPKERSGLLRRIAADKAKLKSIRQPGRGTKEQSIRPGFTQSNAVPATPPSPELNGNWGFHAPSPGTVATGLGILGGAGILYLLFLAPAGA